MAESEEITHKQRKWWRRAKVPESIQTTVYRVVQEALNNARKHSGTDVVRIELKKANGELHLEIRDFGDGFDLKSARNKGFGLLGMTERVRLIGGECLIHSEQGVGTRISARSPFPPPEAVNISSIECGSGLI